MASQEDIDAMQARINVALAKSQKLVSSWLPPVPETDTPSLNIEELQRQEDEMFKPAPPRLGVGAIPLEKKGTSSLEDDALLRKLKLSKKVRSMKHMARDEPPTDTAKAITTPSSTLNKSGTVEEEEEESRSSLGRHKKLLKEEDDGDGDGDGHGRTPTKKKRASTYLDELLAERGKKKKKREA